MLVSPQIPPNTGNVARLCAVTGCRLILVEPLGFAITDKDLRRAGLDYWDKVFVRLFPNYTAYTEAYPDVRRVLFSARAKEPLYRFRFQPGDHLVFGSETKGLGPEILEGGSGALASVPMLEGTRSLNLATSVGIAAYEAIRQVRFST